MASVIRVRIVAGLVILLTFWPLRAEGQHRAAVLILFGDDPSQPWIQPMSDAVSRVLYRQGAASPEPYFEYLDAVRFPDPTHRGLVHDTIRRKYADTRFSLILGLGLGLSIVRSIVVAHGGRISGQNAADGGAVFRVTLPQAPGA
jgi:hypothetical protein